VEDVNYRLNVSISEGDSPQVDATVEDDVGDILSLKDSSNVSFRAITVCKTGSCKTKATVVSLALQVLVTGNKFRIHNFTRHLERFHGYSQEKSTSQPSERSKSHPAEEKQMPKSVTAFFERGNTKVFLLHFDT
jgi:hypothetical protein